jgi:uncharacterized protein (TIGR02145 family)
MKGFKKNIFRSDEDTSALCLNCIPNIVTIGTQKWTGCNANTKFYNNGDPIPYVSDPTTWASLTFGAWCYYNNDPASEATYGVLYNWYAVNDPRGISPVGYTVPTQTDWTTLTTFLGGTTVAGGKMKETGLCHWSSPNTDATNTSLFTGLPGGDRLNTGSFNGIYNYGWWWSSEPQSGSTLGWLLRLDSINDNATVGFADKLTGTAVRFIENPCPNCLAHNVTIGTQTWTGCNATVSTYRDGTTIPYVDDPITWIGLTTGAWCWYNNDPSTEVTYGKLYNWYAATDTLHGGIAPIGYHVPSDAEWTVLTNYLGGLSVAGGKMKETGLCHWTSPNTDATNSSLFTGLPGGNRIANGNYSNIGNYGFWWSSTESSPVNGYAHYIGYNSSIAVRSFGDKIVGLSLRFIEDISTCQNCVAQDVTIGTQVWKKCNANIQYYNNGDVIPYVGNNASWAALTTGAWCYYNNDPSTEATYGLLYNWYAIMDSRGLAPSGYHIPTKIEFDTLATFLGGASVAGGKMKEVGFCHWDTLNGNATNTSNFTAFGAGLRVNGGNFGAFKQSTAWWTTTAIDASNVWSPGAQHFTTSLVYFQSPKNYGQSIRFIRD